MTKNLKKILISVCCVVLVFCAFLGVHKFVPTYAADSTLISMTGTASANLKSEERSGLRFAARIESNGFIALLNEYGEENVEAGMMTVPTDYLKDALDKGNDFTVAGIDAYGRLSGYTYYGISQNFVEVKDGETLTAYEFYMTVDGISLSNYNRDYSARAFIRVKAQELVEIDGVDNSEFSKEGDYYYSYAAYNKDTHETARNVYEVAYDAYIKDAVGDSQEIAKKFIDGVAVLEYDEQSGKVVIANNQDEYESPYVLKGNYIDEDYYIFGNAVTYNGERVTAKKIKDTANGVEVNISKSNGAKMNADGSVTLEGRQLTGGLGWGSGVRDTLDNSYISFEGDYGVGTYIDFTYKGNNLPQVMLFANNINGNLTCGNSSDDDFSSKGAINNGYVIMNGLYTKTGWDNTNKVNIYSVKFGDRILCAGPYRIDPSNVYNADGNLGQICSTIQEIEQNYLVTDTSENVYKYTVGSYVNNGTVYIELRVKNLTTGINVNEVSYSTGKTKEFVESLGGNIVVYGCVKENYEEGTTFSFSSPYQSTKEGVKSYEARFNKNDSVTLEPNNPTGNGWSSGYAQSLKNSYVAFEGGYGVGTYVDFTFKGNNMPQVCLFANVINSKVTKAESSSDTTNLYNGYLVMNGGYYYQSASSNGEQHMDKLVCFGPNRIDGNLNYYWPAPSNTSGTINGCAKFGQTTLISTPDTEYKYTIGSFVQDGVVYIDVSLYSLTASKSVASGTYSTGLAKGDVESKGGNIIVFGSIKKDMVSGTTFSYGEPYKTMKDGVESSGAIFNEDGSVSLAHRNPTGGNGWSSGYAKTLDNSYVAFSGNYGVGTYIDFTFTGNNMPQVTLFANVINGKITGAENADDTTNVYNGYILMNGAYYYANSTLKNVELNKLVCFGPRRMYSNANYNAGTNVIASATVNSYHFGQNHLDANTTYKYTVGSFVDGDVVYIDVSIANATTREVLKTATWSTGEAKETVEALGGNIIAFGCLKAGTEPTTFSYTAPRTGK